MTLPEDESSTDIGECVSQSRKMKIQTNEGLDFLLFDHLTPLDNFCYNLYGGEEASFLVELNIK